MDMFVNKALIAFGTVQWITLQVLIVFRTTKSTAIIDLLFDIGLRDQTFPAGAASKSRYVWFNDKLEVVSFL
jgi:hypothetical protein